MTDTQKIFSLSVVNGADNQQHLLPSYGWTWPKETWLEKRLEKIRKERGDEERAQPED